MAQTDTPLRRRSNAVVIVACTFSVLTSALAWAAVPREPGAALDQKAFFRPELTISTENAPLEERARGASKSQRVGGLSPRAGRGSGPSPDARLHRPALGRGHEPPRGLSPDPRRRGRQPGHPRGPRPHASAAPSGPWTPTSVAAAVRALRRGAPRGPRASTLAQLGEARASQVAPDLWQVSIPQVYRGVPVRDARLAATISHGNLVVDGDRDLGRRAHRTRRPPSRPRQALEAGFAYAGGRAVGGRDRPRAARSRSCPSRPAEHPAGRGLRGPGGRGLRPPPGLDLRVPAAARRRAAGKSWWTPAAARSLAFQDMNQYAAAAGHGRRLPADQHRDLPERPRSAASCRAAGRCPSPTPASPAPNNFTNSAGIFNYTERHRDHHPDRPVRGHRRQLRRRSARARPRAPSTWAASTASTTAPSAGRLAGQHRRLALRLLRGQQDRRAGARLAARQHLAAEPAHRQREHRPDLQRLLEPGRGTINFYRSGGGCRNTGEIAGVFDHEWGHGLDDNDAGGALSNSSEGYADIAAIYRLQTSCVGHGFFWTIDRRLRA